MASLEAYLEEHRDKFEEDLFELLKIPSVSADGAYQQDVARAGQWIADHFQRLGFEVQVHPTEGHPIVYAESPPVEGVPTVLVYGHYDVQPPDPMDEWISDPFEPTVRDGNVFARGATDDKGQMLTHIKSAQAWMETAGSLPVQIKYLIEGEEEVGSQNLYKFIEESRQKLSCDIAVISDTCQFGPGQPAITYGLRGIAYFELQLTGPRQDLHSGTFGGAVTNPGIAICQMLSALIDDEGRIQIPGFYDQVTSLEDRERSQISNLPFDERVFMEQVGVEGLSGEVGYTTLERRWVRPTFDINGIWGGYQGEGGKTVLPSKASAKFSFRLVPDQDPDVIAESLEGMLQEICPEGIRMELTSMHGAKGVVVPLKSDYMTAAAHAIERGFGHSPVFIREGGSIPVVSAFHDQLGVDTLLLGWGLDDDNTHSPNEKFSLADYHRGIKASTYLWQELSKITTEEPDDAGS
ncbi:MAG: dipeptidase [Pirellulaceae bacterium]